MLKRIALIFISLLFVSCSGEDTQSEPKIYGAWILKSLEGLGYSTIHVAYLDNGKKCEIEAKYSFRGDHVTHFHLSKWQLDGNLLVSVLEQTTSSMTPGTQKRHVIHRLTDTELNILLEQSNDLEFADLEEHLRLVGHDPNAICLVVEGSLRKTELLNQLEQNRL